MAHNSWRDWIILQNVYFTNMQYAVMCAMCKECQVDALLFLSKSDTLLIHRLVNLNGAYAV